MHSAQLKQFDQLCFLIEMVFDDNQINFATTSSAALNCHKRIAKILFSFIPFMKYDLAKCETGMWQESAFQNFNNLTNLNTFKFLLCLQSRKKTHPAWFKGWLWKKLLAPSSFYTICISKRLNLVFWVVDFHIWYIFLRRLVNWKFLFIPDICKERR